MTEMAEGIDKMIAPDREPPITVPHLTKVSPWSELEKHT
jgi:hypothetical protein